jgi:diguanylate cyclase
LREPVVAVGGAHMNMQLSNATSGGNTPAGPVADIAAKVALAMRAMGVVGLPRNYEIFYEVFAGANPELNADLGKLGNRPRQDDLDQLSVKYFAQANSQRFVEDIRNHLSEKVEEVMKLFEKERVQLERYGSILNQTSDGLHKRSLVTQEILHRISNIMSAATDTKIEQGKQIVSSIEDKSAELEDVKSKLEEYKKLADTDPLTQLYNRRAFDRAIARIYDDKKRVLYSCLVLVDIDRFKQINDRFGHPVGDKIIQHIASVVRSAVPEGVMVARTGGEEFAVIMEGLGEDQAAEVGETVRKMVEKLAATNNGSGLASGSITVSVGTCMAIQAESADDLYVKADRALYVSKANGRNRCTRFSELPDMKSAKGWRIYSRD